MRRRPFGDSGFETSVIGLGMAALGRPGYLNLGHGSDLAGSATVEALRSRSHRVLDAAWAGGVTYFDVARSYGRGEEFLGSWLAARSDRSIVVGSKWGYTYTANWRADAEVHEVKTHDLATLERQLDETRRILGDRLTVYQIHSATLGSGVLDDEIVLDRLAALRDEGTLVGFSTSGPRQHDTIMRAIDIERGGDRLFASVQATWNLLEPSAGPALQRAHAAGLGVIVKEALANGRLAGREPPTTTRLPADHPPDAIALAAVLAQPWCTTVLSGAVTVDQLQSNLLSLRVPGDVLDDVPSLAEPAPAYWEKRAELRWT